MALRRLITGVSRHQSQLGKCKLLSSRSSFPTQKFGVGGGVCVNRLLNSQKRYQSSYVGNLARRARDADEASELTHLKDLYHRGDPEAVIRLFESQPSMYSNLEALLEYVKALVKVDRLDGSELLKVLQRGVSMSAREEENIGGLAAFKNVRKSAKDGILGTASAPIHMVSAEGGNFKEQLWRTIRTIALAFLLISGVGALIEDKGISKGLGLNEEVQPSMESNTKFNDVKGVDEAKAELEEIVHYLRDPKVLKADDVDLMIIARGTPGFPGADHCSRDPTAAATAKGIAPAQANSQQQPQVVLAETKVTAKTKGIAPVGS